MPPEGLLALIGGLVLLVLAVPLPGFIIIWKSITRDERARAAAERNADA